MKLGTAKRPVTPPAPLRLCGYANRIGPYTEVKEDIFVRVHLMEQGGSRLLWIYGDLLWWGGDFVRQARPSVARQSGVPEENIFFVASHNHSGPPTGQRFIPLLETFSPEYAAFLTKRVLEAVEEAEGRLEAVTLRRFDGRCALNVYRRLEMDGEVLMRPNYAHSADRSLSVLGFFLQDGTLKGSIVQYACHANVAGQNQLHPDYPGIALRLLDHRYPGSVSLFLQGCTADLRPNCVLGDRFHTGGYAEAVTFAGLLAEYCAALLDGPGETLEAAFSCSHTVAMLAMRNRKTDTELRGMLQTEDAARRQWAHKVLEQGNPSCGELAISRVRLAPGCVIYTFSAEVSEDYAAFARSVEPGAICAAYTNGMEGYVCTARQIRRGGYEPEGSALYFALAGTYAPEIQETIQTHITNLREEG